MPCGQSFGCEGKCKVAPFVCPYYSRRSPPAPMSEAEKQQFLTAFCDYAEKRGAWFPNGRPDKMKTTDA